jgi:hypothetical protein
MLASLGFAKCYINDIIIFNLALRDHMHHLREMFEIFKEHNLKLHPSKFWFFHVQVENLSHMIYLGKLWVQKANVKAISHVPQPINLNWLQAFMGLCNYY